MTLDVLVPHWNEDRETMEPLLDSILVQQQVDFADIGVVIAYDGPDASELPIDEWRDRYPFKITPIHAGKGGVSHTRNAALDASDADYVMFCDADDMFCDVCGLYVVFREMQGDGFDTLVSCFREQTKDQEGNLIFVNHDMDSTFVHGKVHRRRYLVDNELRFDDALTVHEDSYFNILCQKLAEENRAKYCPQPFYLWKWRDDSVCRHDPKYILRTYSNMLDSNDALVDEFIKRMRDDLAKQYVGFMIFDAYYTMNKREWLDVENETYRNSVERRFAKYYRKHRGQWEALTDQEKVMISNGVRQRSVMEGMLMEAVTIGQWLRQVLRNHKK